MASLWQSFRTNALVGFLSSLKLAVVVIVFFIVAMAAGTIVESLYGREFAKRLVYESAVFWGVLICLFLNVLFAALVRLPWKKRLSGFYLIHLGMLTILVGGTVTYFYGVDGSLELFPNEPTNRVLIEDSVLYTSYRLHAPDAPISRHVLPLPAVVRPYAQAKPFARVGDYDLFIEKYLPYAESSVKWLKAAAPPEGRAPYRMIEFTLANDRFEEPVSLGNVPGYESETKVGLLSAKLLPTADAACLQNLAKTEIGYLFIAFGECIAFRGLPDGRFDLQGFEFSMDRSGNTPKLSVTRGTSRLVFYPEIATSPVTDDRQLDTRYDAKLIKLDDIRATPHVLFFRERGMVYGKGERWTFSAVEPFKAETLPWMGLKLEVSRMVEDRLPYFDWHYRRPSAVDGAGKQEALFLKIVNRRDPTDAQGAWASSVNELTVPMKGGNFVAFIGRRVHNLNFFVTLTRFKMDTNPGTKDPASYESFVKVSEKDGTTTDAHVYMNNPLKRDRYTLYQSSFFPLPNSEDFGSVFSVNYDPGRPIKYAGSLIFVVGAILHYYLRRKSA